MAAKTLYQKQADKRTKTALKLRARWDARARKYATALVSALTSAADAKARLDRLNLLYGVDISTETLLVHALRTAGLGGSLSTALGESTPGEEVQLFNPTADGNGGAVLVLVLEALFGELAAPTPPNGRRHAGPWPGGPRGARRDAERTRCHGPGRSAGGFGGRRTAVLRAG